MLGVKLAPYWHGWLMPECERGLKSLCLRVQPKAIVEVGVWLGLATRAIHRSAPQARIYCVDTWNGSPEMARDPSLASMLPTLFEQFLANIASERQMSEQVVSMRRTSLEAAAWFLEHSDAPVDLVYVDAAHDYDSVSDDLRAWSSVLSRGAFGILCGDDYANEANDVRRAVDSFAADRKLTIHADGYFWWTEIR